jgi:hypothetical protein
VLQALTHSSSHRLWKLLVSIVTRRELAEQQPGSLIVSQRSGFSIIEESQMVTNALKLDTGVILAAVSVVTNAFQPGERKGAETLVLYVLSWSRKTQVSFACCQANRRLCGPPVGPQRPS